MATYRHGDTGYAGVNAAMGANFARGGGIMGMFKDPAKAAQERQIAAEIKLQEMRNKGNLDVEGARTEGTIKSGNAAADADILKVLGFSPNDMNDPAKKQIVDMIKKVRGETGLTRAKSGQEQANVEGEQYGVKGIKASPEMNPNLKDVEESNVAVRANTPTISALGKGEGNPMFPVGRDYSQPKAPIDTIMPHPATSTRGGYFDMQTGQQVPAETTVQSSPPMPVLTPGDYQKRLQQKGAGAVPAVEPGSEGISPTPFAPPAGSLMDMLKGGGGPTTQGIQAAPQANVPPAATPQAAVRPPLAGANMSGMDPSVLMQIMKLLKEKMTYQGNPLSGAPSF